MVQLRFEDAKRFPDELKKVEERRKAIARSEGLAELRVFRNAQIGHTLRDEPPPTTYHSIPLLIDDLFEFLESAFRLCGDARWIGQASKKRMNLWANEFWDCVESGARARSEA